VKLLRFLACAAILSLIDTISYAAVGPVGAADFRAQNGIWLYKGKPFFSTTAHAIHHRFRGDREGALEDLKRLKEAGFSVVEVYWSWRRVLKPDNSWDFKTLDDFVLASKALGLKNFCMLEEVCPEWLAAKYGWSHTNELGKPDTRIDDFYMCDPSYIAESRRFYEAIVKHLMERPEVSENILYFNMGGEYKPFRPIRQERPIDYGYDDFTVAAFRDWLKSKGLTPKMVELRWGAPRDVYKSWEDVWPPVSLKKTDYKDRDLKGWGIASWDWFEFRQEIASKHMMDAVALLRGLGETRPLIHEYNTVIPGGQALFLDWSRTGARLGSDGIFLGTGSFDREFDFPSVLFNLAIARGASDPPWQSNEQGGMTTPEWMQRHAWFMIAMGGTGLHFWEWRGKDWGILNDDGSPKDSYASAVRLNAQFNYLGDLFKSSRPMPNRIGILLLPEETLYAPYAHLAEVSSLLKSLLAVGSGCEVAVITDDELLSHQASGYRAIIVPGQMRTRLIIREKLAEFVRNGGVLWLTAQTAQRDEGDQELFVNPAKPLDEVAGVRGPFSAALTLEGSAGSKGIGVFGMLDRHFGADKAKVVGSVGGRPALWVNNYGKGKCFMQAAHLAQVPAGDNPLARDPEAAAAYVRVNSGQVPVEIVERVLKAAGIQPYVRLTNAVNGKPVSTVMAGVRTSDPGYILFLIEGDNRRSQVCVALNAKRLGLKGHWSAYDMMTLKPLRLSSDATFTTTISPAEVKIVHLVPQSEFVKCRDRLKAANWPAIETTLPKIRQTKLVPPSELGAAKVGDLSNVRPKPYGDKWLLLDISKHANRSLIDEGRLENAKAFLGSIGTGDNDLTELPYGLQEFLGVPFDILDPNKNSTSCMITKTRGRPWLGPLEFKDIPVRAKVKKVHWLYGSGWAPGLLPVAYITYNYADGSRVQENVVCDKNIANWWGYGGPPKNPDLRLAWAGSTPASRRNFTQVGLWHYAWRNPYPSKEIKSIDISSYGGDACIIVVAITAEK